MLSKRVMPSFVERRWSAVALLLVGASYLGCSRSSSTRPGGLHGAGTGGEDAAGAAGRANAGRGGSNSTDGEAGSNDAGHDGSTGAIGGTSGRVGAGGSGASHVGSAGHAAAGSGHAGSSSATGGSGATVGDAGAQGTAGEGTECDLGTECGRGTCWEWLSGYPGCVNPIEPPPPADCFGSDPSCCTSNADCTAADGGLCIPRVDTELSCGGKYPDGNTCNYDACADDQDCEAAQPADASVAICLPRGAIGVYTSMCAYGGCRTDRDCTQGEDGQCRYDLAATHVGCDLHYVLYCAYASDPCKDRYGSCSDTTQVCAPNDDFQGRHCVPAPPMYP